MEFSLSWAKKTRLAGRGSSPINEVAVKVASLASDAKAL
jgi:hypothetical protein